jgi:hypothetical protein
MRGAEGHPMLMLVPLQTVDGLLLAVLLVLIACEGLAFSIAYRKGRRPERLSKRQAERLLRAWDEFDLGRNRPEPPRRPVMRSDLWDEWLDGDHTPRPPGAQKNPRGRPRGIRGTD